MKARSSIERPVLRPRRYDLSRVGRYKYNKKLNLAGRITGRQLSRPIVNPATGEVMAEAGTVVSRTLAEDIDNAGVTTAWVALEDDKETKVISNGMVDIAKYVSFDAEAECGINERVRYAVLSEILEECGDDEEKLKEQLTARHDELIPNHIIIDDIFSSINYMTCLAVGLGLRTISTSSATAVSVPSASCCRTSSASASPAWSA